MTVDLVAHRGFAGRHPENTVRAVRRSARHADWVEVDVRRCGSGDPVVIHDATLDRVTDATGPVVDRTAAELSALSVLGSGEGVPTLDAVLDALPPGVGINAELKEPVWDALATIEASDRERVLVSAFDADVLGGVRERSALDTALLTRDAAGAVETAADLGCVALHPHHAAVDADLVARAHERDLAVNAWTVTHRSTADRLRAAGADGVIADAPDVA